MRRVCAHIRKGGAGEGGGARRSTQRITESRSRHEMTIKGFYFCYTLCWAAEKLSPGGLKAPSQNVFIKSSLVFEIPPPMQLLKLCSIWCHSTNISLFM